MSLNDAPVDWLPVPWSADLRRAGAAVLHAAGPAPDREGLLAALAEAEAEGRTAELFVAVLGLARALYPGLVADHVEGWRQVLLCGADLEARGLTGRPHLDDEDGAA